MSSSNDPQAQTTLNVPSLLAFAVISFFAIRYLFFSSSSASQNTSGFPGSASSSSRGSGARRGPQVSADRVEQVVVMFPQLNRREVEWDLIRNGGSVAATTERVLREGRLPQVS